MAVYLLVVGLPVCNSVYLHTVLNKFRFYNNLMTMRPIV